MRSTLLIITTFLFFSNAIFSQPVVSLVDTALTVYETDSIAQIFFRIENPNSESCFLFETDYQNSTAVEGLDYMILNSEINVTLDTVFVYSIRLLQDNLIEGNEEILYDLKKFYDSCIDTVNLSGPTHFVLTILDDTTTSINDLSRFGLETYPNPSKGLFEIKADKKISEISVFNAQGQIVNPNIHHQNLKSVLDLAEFPDGIYFVKIRIEESVLTQKILLKK